MKKALSMFIALFLLLSVSAGLETFAATDITADFVDVNFREVVYTVIEKTAPEPIYDTDVSEITYLDAANAGISSLAGIENFTELKEFRCEYNQLSSLDVSKNTKLRELWCNNNYLTTLDVSKNTGLQFINCEYNGIPSKADVIGYDDTSGYFLFDPQYPHATKRIFGESRIETAIRISLSEYNRTERVMNVVLANGWSFPDALAGGPLAYMLDAPILLTKGGAALEREIIDRINTEQTIYILGGESVISKEMFDWLKVAGCEVERISGNDRYETAVAIARKMDELRGSDPEVVFVADGLNFADAMSATPVAALMGAPILFTPNTSAQFRTTSANYATACGAEEAVIVGGPVAVKPGIENSLADLGFSCERVFGLDRFETSVEIYAEYEDLFCGHKAFIATGRNFPDALAGGVLAAKFEAPLFLVNGTGATSAPVKAVLGDFVPRSDFYVLGGPAVVTDAVINNHIG